MTQQETQMIINAQINTNKTDRQRRVREEIKRGYRQGKYMAYDVAIFAPSGLYRIKEMPNNKPLTLLKEKNAHPCDFVAFVNVKEYKTSYDNEIHHRFVYFDITEDKKTKETADFLPKDYAWRDARKDAGRIFIVLNENIHTYAENLRKHNERADNRQNMTTMAVNRWDYSAELKNLFWHLFYNSNWTTIKDGDLDKSGYYLPYYRDTLKRRAQELHNKREEERREREKVAFCQSDKSNYIKRATELLEKNKTAMEKMMDFNAVMTRGALRLLNELKDNILELQKLKKNLAENPETYARWHDPVGEINAKLKEIQDAYYIAITQHNDADADWCSPSCYKIENGEIIAKYDWIGSAGCHANEVTKSAIIMGDF